MDDLKIKEGITDSQINQLVEYTNLDSQIKTLTSDFRRFMSREMADKWFLEVKPIIYTLIDKKDNLKGIVWFTEYPIRVDIKKIVDFNPDDYQLTFAIRLYDDARGKGLAVKFFKECFKKVKETNFYKSLAHNGLWLGTHPQNIPAINLYKKLGFIQVNDNEDEINRVVMIKPGS